MGSAVNNQGRRVVITGTAYLTCLGFGDADHEGPLRQGVSGARPILRFDTTGFRTRVGGECNEADLDSRLADLVPRSRWRGMGVDTRMLLWATASALRDSGLPPGGPLSAVFGTTLEGLARSEEWYRAYTRQQRARPRGLIYATSGAQVSAVVEMLGLPLRPQMISNACATGISAIGRMFRRIRNGECETGLAGGYDCLSPFIHLGFDSLGALTREKCAPFDRDRSGFFIGDGAAVLVLEELQAARRRGARIRGELLGYGESVDSFHITQPDPEGTGVARAIRDCLRSAGVQPQEIDYINAHGTATPANDSAEAAGILRALGETGRRIPISSTKAQVGHMLGAAGAVEQCFCLLALERGFTPLQANFQTPDPSCPLNVVRGVGAAPRVAMNNAFGFGGANGVLLTRRWEESA